jgi:heme/copper-type cytochrome/quinol oxidase subunit 1
MGGGAHVRRVLPWATAVLGLALVVSGARVSATADPARPTAFGWYAYAPLAEETTAAYSSTLDLTFGDGGTVVWSDGQVLGAALVVGGLLLLAALAGWAVGRRVPRRPVEP